MATTSQQLLAREGDIPLDGSSTTSERNPVINDNKFNQPSDEVLQKPSISDVQLDNNEAEDDKEKTTVSFKKEIFNKINEAHTFYGERFHNNIDSFP